MRIFVIGTGYVGLVTGACFARMGHDVICSDIDEEKISNLSQGIIPIFEPELEDLVKETQKNNRLQFTTDIGESVQSSDLIFICVGTPSDATGAADLSSVKAVAKEIGRKMNGYKVIVNKSTVPVGSMQHVKRIVRENTSDSCHFDVVSNPEFLKEGSAIKDFLEPDRIVIGTDSQKAANLLAELYTPLGAPILVTDPESAEMIKYASNAFLATKISFINEVARICEKFGADVKEVAKGMGYDSRIGPQFLEAGAGWGGSCFPKDSKALAKMARENNCNFSLLEGAIRINDEQKKYIVAKVERLVGDLKEKRIGVLGISFKPRTDDVRYSPAIAVIQEIKSKGAKVSVYDPVAEESAKKIIPDIEFNDDVYETTKGSDALVLLTAWEEFKNLDFPKIKRNLKMPVFIDARNFLEPSKLKQIGFTYEGVGR